MYKCHIMWYNIKNRRIFRIFHPLFERGTFMKKVVSLLLALLMLVLFVGCPVRTSSVEDALIAVRKLDLDAFEKLLSADTVANFARVRDYDAALTASKREALRSLYGKLQYTMGEESEPENGTKTVSVTLTLPDMAQVRSIAQAEILASGRTVEEIIADMLANGTVASNTTTVTLSVKLTEQDGAWYIPYSDTENAALLQALALSEMFRFFAMN